MANRGVHRLGTRQLCWYAVDEGGKLTLVDGGLVRHWTQLEALLGRLDRTPADIAALVVSHGHPDHFGIASRLREAVPGVRILVHEADQDGDELDIPGRPKVVHAPGHTPGNCAFLLGDRGVLFSGDALITLDVRGRHRPGVALESTSLDHKVARRSLERLRTIDAYLVLPGHGDPWVGTPRQALEAAGA